MVADLIYECREETKSHTYNQTPEEVEELWRNWVLPTVEDADPDEVETVVVAQIGDYGSAGANELAVSTLVKSWDPDFVVTSGDNNYTAGAANTIDANIGQYYAKFIYPYTGGYALLAGETAATANQFWPVLGNRDWDGTADPLLPTHYTDYFTLPNNERYYDFVVGDVHFFMLDSGFDSTLVNREPDGITQYTIQYDWWAARMAQSTAKWKIVVLHHPPYSNTTGKTTIGAPLQWDYKAKGADLVIAGHAHNYERLLVDGLPYIVNGAGGYSISDTFIVSPVDSVLRYNTAYGALKVTVSSAEFKAEFINVSGTVIDTLTLTK